MPAFCKPFILKEEPANGIWMVHTRGEINMIANYHTHTPRCHHAWGDEREYVEQAIEKGLKILGFSDHVAVPFHHYESGIRMRPDEVENYVTTVLDLRDEYRRDIEIHVGFEVEYFPAVFDEQLELLSQYPIEYYLLGQHFTNNEYDGIYCGDITQSKEVLLQYCRQSLEGLKTGCFTYFAHPDLINFKGDQTTYEQCMRNLCKEVKALSIPLEINLLGIMGNRHYPNPLFWQIAGEVGNDVILGSDAHLPKQVVDENAIAKAMEMVQKNHLHLLETVSLVNPFHH